MTSSLVVGLTWRSTSCSYRCRSCDVHVSHVIIPIQTMGILSLLCTICAEFLAPTFTGGRKKRKKKAAEQVVNKYTPHTHTHTHTHTTPHTHTQPPTLTHTTTTPHTHTHTHTTSHTHTHHLTHTPHTHTAPTDSSPCL